MGNFTLETRGGQELQPPLASVSSRERGHWHEGDPLQPRRPLPTTDGHPEDEGKQVRWSFEMRWKTLGSFGEGGV